MFLSLHILIEDLYLNIFEDIFNLYLKKQTNLNN